MAEHPSDEPRDFAVVLCELSRGTTNALLSKFLRDVTAAVKETQNKGSLTFTLEVAPGEDGDTVIFTDKIGVKVPQHDRKATLFFVNRQGDPVRDIPQGADLLLNQPMGGAA